MALAPPKGVVKVLKLNKLFHKGGADDNVFEDRIAPTTEQRKFLMGCKNKIRDHLKPRIRAVTKAVLGMDRVVEPRFRTQGSWSYNTCVVPAQPSQEMDWDYGVYLPVTVWEENGPPHKMAKVYFALVEELLKDLCETEGWKLLTGKSTCIRIQVATWAHIDIPLYAAPEDEFATITERASLEKAVVLDSANNMIVARAMNESFEPQEWKDLDHIAMATRSGEWRESDPEAVANWFRDRIEEHGEQLRRICCYLKAWRDVHWQSGGPTSVSIMIAVAQNFIARKGRDDLALEDAAKHLGEVFKSEIREAGIDDEKEDFNRLSDTERAAAARRFSELGTAIHDSRMLREHQKPQAITQMRSQFGSRMPWDNSLIELDSEVDAIRNTAPEKVAPPVVLSSSAG